MLRITSMAIVTAVLSAFTTHAQTYTELLAEGKKQIKEQRSRPDAGYAHDYAGAIAVLRKAASMCPDSPEVHYFLGSAMDYDTKPDGRQMNSANAGTTLLVSSEFERVIKLSPKYNGEKVVLSPYTKIGSIWGCLAMAYMVRNDYDSARWAFREGKKRGGFGDFTLNYYRCLLNACPRNTILFSVGDHCSMTCWYLQEVENLRSDITVLEINMIQIPWYNAFLYQKHSSIFSSPRVALDTNTYGEFDPYPMQVTDRRTNKQLRWKVPSRLSSADYLFLADFILLDIVKYNKFDRPICFTDNMDKENLAGLDKFLQNGLFINRLTTDSLHKLDADIALDLTNFPFGILKDINRNNDEEMNVIKLLQYKYLIAIEDLLQRQRKSEATNLYTLLTTNLPEEQYPYWAPETTAYIQELAKKLKSK